MLVIEFAGNPGVGKSTVCKKAVELLENEGFSCNSIVRNELRLGFVRRKLFSVRYRTARCNTVLKKAMKKYIAYYKGANAYTWGLEILKASYKLHAMHGDGLVFLEEGPTQFLTSIVHMSLLDDKSNPFIKEINRAIYSYDVILFDITTPEQENVKRIRNRVGRKDRFACESDPDVLEMLQIKRNNLNIAESKLRYRKLIRVENTDADESAQLVCSFIKEELKEGD